jgi:hypothetical protein
MISDTDFFAPLCNVTRRERSERAASPFKRERSSIAIGEFEEQVTGRFHRPGFPVKMTAAALGRTAMSVPLGSVNGSRK